MRPMGLRSLIFAIATTMSLASPAMADLGAAKSFAVLSSTSSVTFKNRDTVNKVSIPGSVACPGAAGCPTDVGGTIISMGRGNPTAPDTINADVIADAAASQLINCTGIAAAICLGNDSEVTGKCITAGGAAIKSSECAGGSDTSGSNSEVTTLLPNAGPDAAAFSASLAALMATQSLSAINLGTHGTSTISASDGLNVISVPSIVTGANATITIQGSRAAMVVLNVGTLGLALGNGSSVLLTGGITPDKVVFNVEGSGGSVRLGNGTTFNGTILAPRQGIGIGNGNTTQPLAINGALLAGLEVSIGNNVEINFYPLGQIAKPISLTVVGTVDINDLPPPAGGGAGGNLPADNSGEVDGGPHIDEVPGQPAPPPSDVGIPSPDPKPEHALFNFALPLDFIPVVELMEAVGFSGLANPSTRVPPDAQLAAGNSRVVEMVNTAGAEYGKLSGNVIKVFDLGLLFQTNKGQGTDPRVMFDADTHTYFAAYELRTPGGDDIRLAVADEPGDKWTVYEVKGNNVDTCFDQPKLGFSTTVITLSWDDYQNAASCTNTSSTNFSGSEYIVVQKLAVLARNSVVPAVIWGPDTSRFAVFPVQSLSPSAVQYAAYHNLGSPTFYVMTLTGVPGEFPVDFTENSYDIGSVSGPPLASQPTGGDATINTNLNDNRVLSAVWQNDNLWGAFNEGCIPQGDNITRSCERFIHVSTGNNSVLQNRRLSSNGQDIYYPAVTLAGNGDLFIGMTFSSPTLNPSALVVGVEGGIFDPTNLRDINLQTGAQAYVCNCAKAGGSRWGDYSGAAPDPNDPTVAWVAQEFGGTKPNGDWGTAIAAVFFAVPQPPTPH